MRQPTGQPPSTSSASNAGKPVCTKPARPPPSWLPRQSESVSSGGRSEKGAGAFCAGATSSTSAGADADGAALGGSGAEVGMSSAWVGAIMSGYHKYCLFVQYTIPTGSVHPQMCVTAHAMTEATPRVPLGPPERCPYRTSPVELVTGAEVYPERPELATRNIWRCTRCDASVGCHKPGARVKTRTGGELISDGTLPMGSLANGDLRAARTETHRLFDALWQEPASMSCVDAYAWMARYLCIPKEDARVACLSYAECIKLQLAIEDLLRPPGETPELPGAAHWLMRAGLKFSVEPGGTFIIDAGDEVIDYFPERQSWKVQGELLAEEQEGLNELIAYCRRRSDGLGFQCGLRVQAVR
ncbi:MAG: hypothetical protein EOO80_00635 [Oxalobacteraceae bacterium]|nr:MAG: hypothetical protein EOO80_00635 [Oxalobacteraceae bacterium]